MVNDVISICMCVCVCCMRAQSLSCVQLCNPMGFPRQEYWSGLPFLTPNIYVVFSKTVHLLKAIAK